MQFLRSAAWTGMMAAALAAAPAMAGWKLVPGHAPVAVAKSTLKVNPAEDWNRSTARPIPKGEVWTLDGAGLNELYFVSGLVTGETLYRDAAKKEAPLPRLGANLQLTDIPEFLESSQRAALDTSAWELTGSAPATLDGKPAIRFGWRYAVAGSKLYRKGMGVAALVDGKLTLIAFTAPEIFYFDRDLPKVEAIVASAKL